MSYLELQSRYILKGRLRALEGLHIGSGFPNTETDAPFLRQAQQPFLPGSSLRGVIRSTVERIAYNLFKGRCCVLFDPESAVPWCAAGNKEMREKFERATADQFDTLRKHGELRFCAICDLFGSTLMASRFKVSDGVLSAQSVPSLIKRDGVGIDRDTETARDKHKFDLEVLEPGCNFDFSVQLENAGTPDFALLYIALKELEHGLDVGGRRARGLGRVQLTGYDVQYFDSSRNHSLADFLEKGFASVKQSDFDGWLKEAFLDWKNSRAEN